jgi:excisionase family DNA binding protein
MTILKLSEVADVLKMNKEVVRRMCKAGQLPAFRVGKMWRVDADDLTRWFQEKSKATNNTEVK